ncbi:hypothetical protein CMI37_31835 [Candidatus Pacearchaeota archaeon]|nr:hypothetical protein [Candidatus Pacearchaeota archaeon]|tara:strand:- start:76 stop:342 length:267 start_codon:yes stop_codon:yes gene_type:complete
MGKFFNRKIRDLPAAEVRRLKAATRVVINPIYGQTKGFLEEMRKEHNQPEIEAHIDMPLDNEKERAREVYEKRVANMAKARAAKKKSG